MRNILEVKNLVRSYNTATFRDSKNNVNVLKGISFQVAEGEFVGIMGKSGCGKTTLLKTLGMIDKPTDGTIKFMGEDTSELYGDKLADIRNSKIGFIFQDFYLMDSLSVEENIMLPMIISKQNINKMIVEAKKKGGKYATSKKKRLACMAEYLQEVYWLAAYSLLRWGEEEDRKSVV